VHATMGSEGEAVAAGMLPRIPLDKEDVLRTLDRMVLTGSS